MKEKRYTVKNRRSRPRRNQWDSREPGFRAGKLAEVRRERRRRNAIIIIIAGLVLSLALFVVIFLLMRSDDDGGDDSFEPGAGGDVSSVIIMVNDENGALGHLLLLAVEDGSYQAVAFPARTIAQVPGQGFLQLGEVAGAGGQQLLDQTVANLVQHPVQYHIATDYDSLQLAAEQVGTIDVQVSQELVLPVDGAATVLAAGSNLIPSSQMSPWLRAAAADGSAGPQVQAALFQGLREAFLARTDTDRSAFAQQLYGRVDTDLSQDQFVELFMAATTSGAAFSVQPLPVRLVEGGGEWYLEPVSGEVESIFGAPVQAAYTLEVRNGTEVTGVVEWAAERLTPLELAMTTQPDVSGVNFEFTQIRYGSDASREANSVRELLGAGTLIKDDNLENNEIIVIIGLDLAASVQGG